LASLFDAVHSLQYFFSSVFHSGKQPSEDQDPGNEAVGQAVFIVRKTAVVYALRTHFSVGFKKFLPFVKFSINITSIKRNC
jgi:hypothetical protein